MTSYFRFILILQLLISGSLTVYSQTPEELRKQADLLFDQGKFVEATPLYSKILAQQPRDYEVNFRYGTCLLYNSHNKEEAIRYLSYAVKGADIDKRAFYYLGRAYHLNYQFNEAIIQYEKFKSVANPAQIKTLEVDQQILACKNGKKLLSNVTDMIVIQKTEIRAEDFYEIYKLNNIGGTILVTDEFQSKMDKQNGHRAIIHFPANSPAIYYSSYGEDGSTGLDIYVKRKLPDGKYSQAQKVQGGVNTTFDENYAYMHPDGKYLYFCSKGHNSMGGYDVFRCAYNESTNTFGTAENMDFAISSPDDDIFFVVDSLDRSAYFASARESQDGKVFVYEVRVDRIPLQIAVIKGSFVNSVNVSNKVVSIEIVDFSSGESIGTFNSKESNGDYLITFPKPGKYKYLITVKGSEDTHVATIEIPYQKEFKPLKQRITVSRDDMGQEFVKVENLFDEAFEDPIAVMAEIYKNMSELMPNSDKYNIDSLDKVNKGNEVFTDAGLDPFVTKEDVEKAVTDEIKDLNTSIAEDEKNAAIAYNLAEQKSDSANALMVEINQNIQLAENTTDVTEKNRILEDVYDDTKKVEQLNEDSKDLVALGNAIDQSIEEKKNDLVQAQQVQQDLNNTPDDDRTALGNVVTENKTFFVENVKNNAPLENVVEEIVTNNASQANTTQKINGEIATLRNEQMDLEAKNVSLQQQADNTNNKKQKEALQQQILANEIRIEELKTAIQQKEKEYEQAINSGGNSNLGNAAQIVDNPKNATAGNTTPLSNSEKDDIENKVQTNNLDANIAAVNKILDENNIGGPAINLFASDETTKNYTLQQWNDAIDDEIDRLNILKMNATGDERIKIEQDIQRYEELRDEKIKQFEVVQNPATIEPEINPEDVVTGYTTRKDEINKLPNEGDRHAENLKLNEELKDELIAEKTELQKILDENPGSKNIEERIANIDKMLAATETQIADDKKWIAQNTGTVVVDTEKIVATVDPGYQNKINEIYKITDPAQRANQVQVLNEAFTEKSSERMQELEAALASNPNDAVAKAELAELKRLNSQISTDATQPLIKPEVLDITAVTPKVTPDQLIEDYTTRKTDISKITDPYDKKIAENNLNKELSTEVRQEIKDLEALLADNPGNTAITERIANLKKLDDQLNSAIVTNEQWLAANPKTDAVVVDASDVKLVNPDYQEKADAINQIQNPDEQKTAIRELNDQTIQKIDNRIEELDRTLAGNPTDQTALDEKAELNQLKTQIQQNPDKLLVQPADYSAINTKPTIGEIMPDYQDKMNTIYGSSQNQADKEKDKIDLNQNLISLIDAEIESLTNAKITNPDAAKAIDKRIEGLTTIKNQKTAEIKASEDKIGGTTVTAGPAITLKDVMPDYEQKIAAIEKKDLDEKNELTEKNAVNAELIEKLDDKISALEAEKAKNPANAAAIERDIRILQDLKTQKQNEITANNQRIADIENGITTTRPAITLNSIMPGYEPGIAAIDQKSADEKTKLAEKNTLHNQLISAIDQKIADLEKEKTTNPANAAAIDKDIQALQAIKLQKQNEITLNNDRINQLNSGTTSRPAITVNSIMPGYEPGIAAIDQKSADEKTKLAEKNTLHNQLISAIDKKIADLEKEKTTNPANAAAIDKDIQYLQNLKTQKQGEINSNNQRISEIDNVNVSARATITINSLMPEYEPGMARIDSGTAPEQDKLREKNKLNQQLIGAIDAKIAALTNELKTDPENTDVIQQDIDKLRELKESKRAEIDKNNNLLTSMGADVAAVKSVEEIKTDDFKSDEGKEMIESHSEDIAEIKEIQNDIADLENQLANTTDPGDQAKLEKQIDKKENSQARLENEILEDLGTINETEYNDTRSNTAVEADIASANNPGDESILEANANVAEADALMAEAQQLRNEAATEKDPVIANQKLQKAFENEQRANELLEEAGLTYKTAAVIDQIDGSNEVIVTTVPENPSDRQSTALYTQAANLESTANDLNAQAAQLRDSSLTVKKKYREALVIEAQQLDSLAAVYRTEANDLKSQAADIKSQEDNLEAVLPQSTDKTVDTETVNDVIATSDYKNYYDAKTIGDSNLFRAEELGNDIAVLQDRKERKIKEAIVTYGTGPELEKALANDPEYKDIQNDLDSLQKLQEQYRDRGIASYQQAENILENTDDQMRESIMAISDRDLAPVEKITITVNPIEADFKAPDQLNASIFRTTDTPVYSSSKPIPVDQQQPSGLVYKVQVGAFRNPLPPEYFNKFAPISGQKIGDGITRYMVGYFTNFTVADNSKEQVHDLGYGDAFVVAYCNGERISIQEAKEIEAGRRQCVGTNLVAVNNMSVNQSSATTTTNTQGGTTNTTQGGTTTTAQITPQTEEEKQLTSYYSNVPDAAKANQVEIIKGLFFTVQIGVYSKPVKASLLYNIQPLNSQLTEDKKIRYTTGIYCNVNDAVKRKDEIVAIGITDAFVTAYYNGKRITLTEANALLAQNGPSVLFDCAGLGTQQATNQGGNQTTNQGGNQTTNQGGNQTTNQGGNQTTNQGGNQTTNQGGNQTTNQGGNQTTNQGGNQTTNQGGNQTTNQGGNQQVYDPSDTSGLWRVRVGYFETEVPQNFIELLLNHQDEGIVTESDGDENMTFYTIPYTNRQDAEVRANDLRSKGFSQAEIQKMPGDVDELGNKIEVPVEPKEIFYKEGVYYRVLIGKYANDIPGEYATILLQTENLLETEVDADGNTYIISTKIKDMATVRERLVELYELGIEDMDIVTYYKYDAVPFEQGERILQDKPIDSLTYFETPQGISADPYLYHKDGVYFRVDLGKFEEDVPQEFANLLFENSDENILREETFEGETYFYTENIKTYEEAETIYKRLLEKGFKDAKLVAFHKYDEISIQKAREILSQP
ncbi:MAG: hypothetical protein HYZ14_07035 [Bacteroidetes bacterium]|nr:hypothetical protein [Bacteroidota bacterium]